MGGELGGWPGAQDMSWGDTPPLDTSTEMWEFHPEGSGDPEPGMTSPVCL